MILAPRFPGFPMKSPLPRLPVALALTSTAFLVTAVLAPPLVAAATAPAPAKPTVSATGLSIRESRHSRQTLRADIIRRLADEEFKAADPATVETERKSAIDLADASRGAERNLRPGGQVLATEHGLLKQALLADQTDDQARLEIAAYSLPESLKKQLQFFPELKNPASPGDSPSVARIRFGRALAEEAARLPAEGRREKLRAFVATNLAKLPKNSAAADLSSLRALYDTEFKSLTELFSDAIAGLEAAELLVQLDGYTAESHAKLAEMLARNGRRAAALAALDAALALEPANERALAWEKKLAAHAPELFTGVVEEPADASALAAAPVWELAGIPPKHAERIAVESAARTMRHRLLAALRVPADQREAAVQQAVELHRGLVGVLTEPTRAKISEAQKAVLAASSERSADKAREAFEGAPAEAASHVLYWQLRAIRFQTAKQPRDVLDCIFVVQAMEPENAWAKSNRAGVERQASAPPKPKPVAKEEHSKTYDEMDLQLRTGFYPLVQNQTDALLAANPANAEALILRARLRLLQADRPGAVVDLRAAVGAGGPLLAEAHGRLAQALIGPKSQEAEVTSEIAEALKLSPDQPDALFSQAVLDLRARKFPEALAALDRAIAVRPEFEEAIALRANVLQQSGKSAEAEKWLRDAIAKRPYSVFLRTSLGLRLITERKFDEVRVLVAEIAKMRHGGAERSASMLKSAVERAERAANPAGPGAAPATPGASGTTPAAPAPSESPRRRPER